MAAESAVGGPLPVMARRDDGLSSSAAKSARKVVGQSASRPEAVVVMASCSSEPQRSPWTCMVKRSANADLGGVWLESAEGGLIKPSNAV